MLSIINHIKYPRGFCLLVLTKAGKHLPDKLYLQIRYFLELGKWQNLTTPRLFHEKLNWLKIHNRKPEYTMMVDKFAVKDYVAKAIGNEHVIPTLGIWNTPAEIDFDALPTQFVLKTTHGGGSEGVVICKDKATFDKEACIKKLNIAMRKDIYTNYREWPYKDVPRKIIAEQFIDDKKNSDLPDYKFFCFNGKPLMCQVITDRNSDERVDFYDMEWNRIMGLVGLNPRVSNSDREFPKPQSFNKMKEIAQCLSSNIPFSRIDLYDINGHCYFGEITFFPAGGMGRFSPIEAEEKYGNLIKLPV